jgi:cell division protein FtsI (penicillin-binding protein 3)
MEMLTLRRPREGRNVHLTIDQAIQAKVQAVIEGTVKQWRAKSATGIVLDPRTGEVLAMATAPGYDNNEVHDLTHEQVGAWTRNRAVEDTYEPGSTFKVVTFAAALSAGIIYPQMKFSNIPYEIQVADKRIHDDMLRGPITLTASQILQQSSNVGTVTIAQMVGKDTLYEWMRKFGFGSPTALHLYGEGSGLVMRPQNWYGSSIGNIPIGQGVSVTPMQMATMYSAIANGGVLVEPHVVRSIEGRPPLRPTRRRIVDANVDHQLVDMLKGVVDTAAGTGVRARIPGYTVAGKTGTAQKAENGGYSKTDYVASFVGFFPAENPQVEVMVVVDSPRGNIFGGVVAAPAFQQIGTFLTQALSIRPDRAVTPAE